MSVVSFWLVKNLAELQMGLLCARVGKGGAFVLFCQPFQISVNVQVAYF